MTSLKQWKDEGVITETSALLLDRFAEMILFWNPRINLTGYKTKKEIEELLIGESIAALKVLDLSGKTVLDFGSGAGIPGLVWSVGVPEVKITSLEIRQKKVTFQKEVVRTLGLRAEILWGLFPQAVSDRFFDVIVSRAIRFSPRLWEDARSRLLPGGMLVRFAGRNAADGGWRSIEISDRSALLVWP